MKDVPRRSMTSKKEKKKNNKITTTTQTSLVGCGNQRSFFVSLVFSLSAVAGSLALATCR